MTGSDALLKDSNHGGNRVICDARGPRLYLCLPEVRAGSKPIIIIKKKKESLQRQESAEEKIELTVKPSDPGSSRAGQKKKKKSLSRDGRVRTLTSVHPIIVHVSTRNKPKKQLSYAYPRPVTHETAPCHVSARPDSEAQP